MTETAAPFNRVWGSSTPGLMDGTATTALFSNPAKVTVAPDGTVYDADYDNDAIRAISPGGIVSTVCLAGARSSGPSAWTMSNDGNTLYIETDGNDMGQRDGTTGTIWALNRASGTANVVARNLGWPRGILSLPDGRIAMSDLVQNVISILDPVSGTITPLAGTAGHRRLCQRHRRRRQLQPSLRHVPDARRPRCWWRTRTTTPSAR